MDARFLSIITFSSGVAARSFLQFWQSLRTKRWASAALTAGSATCQATIRNFDDTVVATGLTAVISGTGATQFNATAQARGLDVFLTTDSIGCRLTTTADIAPLTAEVACTVIVEL